MDYKACNKRITKACIDGYAQERRILRYFTSSVPWEQKIISQIFKTVTTNIFLVSISIQFENFMYSSEKFIILV